MSKVISDKLHTGTYKNLCCIGRDLNRVSEIVIGIGILVMMLTYLCAYIDVKRKYNRKRSIVTSIGNPVGEMF